MLEELSLSSFFFVKKNIFPVFSTRKDLRGLIVFIKDNIQFAPNLFISDFVKSIGQKPLQT